MSHHSGDPPEAPQAPETGDADLSASVARLRILLNDARGDPPEHTWERVRAFFHEYAERLPRDIRNEFINMQTALFASSADLAPRPLQATEKVERLLQIIWRWQGARTQGGVFSSPQV
jgi:AcrR family transcriptional regulator